MTLHPRLFLLLVLATLASPRHGMAQSSATQPSPTKPNFLVIMVDDLGYADLGIHGGNEVPTPHIDALAAAGVRFTNGYVTAPYCSPSRAGFLTGRYQTRFGHEFNPHVGEEAALGLPLTEKTIANYWKEAGYRTALIGKWHQGFSEAHHPQSRGFDDYFGFLVGGHNFLLRKDAQPKFGSAHSHDMIYEGRQVQHGLEGYTTDLFTDRTISFIDACGKQPWGIYLAYNAVHTPLEISPHLRDRIPAAVSDPNRRGYLSLLIGLDDSIGRLRAHLKNTQRDHNTLIIFVSDNGGSGKKPFLAYNTGQNNPLRGHKGQTLEGGIRVPFFAVWPGHIRPNTLFQSPVSTLDILPTTLAAAGVTLPPNLDGVDLAPHFTGTANNPPHAELYWRFGPQKAIREHDWKLVEWRDFEAKTNSGWQLFNLKDDLGETQNLASESPEIVARLSQKWHHWNQSNIEPKWRGSRTEDPATAP